MEIRTLDGKRIDIKKGEKAVIELNNSLFNDNGTFVGSYSYPVKLALTPETLEAIDFAPNLEKKIRNPLIPVVVFLNGQVFKKSVLSLSVNKGEVEGALQIDLRLINDLLKNTFLDEVPAEEMLVANGEVDLVAKMKTICANTDWRVYPYTFVPVKNPLFVGSIEQPGVSYGVLYSNTVINEFEFSGGTFQFLKSTGGGYRTDVNSDVDLKHKVPYFYLCYVLQNVCNFLGYQATGDFLTHPDVEKILIDNINELIAGGTASTPCVLSADNHLPHLTLEDFFKALIGFFNIRITLNTTKSTINFSFKKSALENPKYVDLRAFGYNILQQTYDEPKGFTLKAETDKLANDIAEVNDVVSYLDGEKKIDVKAGTLRTDKNYLPGSTTQYYDVLATERPGNLWDGRSLRYRENSVNKNGIKDFPLRFFFTKGVTASAYGVNYPSGGINGAFFSLTFNGSNSLYNFAYKNWLEKTNDAKKIRIQILLPVSKISGIADDSVLILESENGASIYALCQKIKFTETENSYSLAEFDLLILDSVDTNDKDGESLFVRVEISGRQTVSAGTAVNEIGFVDYKIYANKAATIPATGFQLKVAYEQVNTLLEYTDYGLSTQTLNRSVFSLPSKLLLSANRRETINTSDSEGRILLKTIWTDTVAKIRRDRNYSFQFKPRRGYTILPTIEIP